MCDKRYRTIRKEFKEKFYHLSQKKKVPIIYEWNIPLLEDDNILLKWKSKECKRILSLQEEADDVFKFTYAIGKTGVKFDYGELLLSIKDSPQQVDVVFELYALWFIEKKSQEEMEPILEKYFTRLNGHPSEYYERLFEENHEPVDEGAVLKALESMTDGKDNREQSYVIQPIPSKET